MLLIESPRRLSDSVDCVRLCLLTENALWESWELVCFRLMFFLMIFIYIQAEFKNEILANMYPIGVSSIALSFMPNDKTFHLVSLS